MDKLISIVVPVYNVEKYLDQCIESIVNQTYKNLEIILVDDGSKDSSGKKCNQWSEKDKRIKVIHKENGGLSDARNVGIDCAKGEYITFIDSDDFIACEYIETLYKGIAEMDCDISICNPYYYYEEAKEKIIKRYEIKKEYIIGSALDMTIELMYQKKFDTSAWGKLYKTQLFKKNNIHYPKGKLYEDIATTYKVFLKAEKIIFINKNLYYYRQRSNSIMGSDFNIKEMDYIENAKTMIKDVSEINPKIEKAAITRFVSANFAIYRKIPDDKRFYKEVIMIKENLKKYRKTVLFDKRSRIKNKLAIIISYINLKMIKFYK